MYCIYTQQRETTRLKKKESAGAEREKLISISAVFFLFLSPMTAQTNLIAKVYGIDGMSNKRLPNYFAS